MPATSQRHDRPRQTALANRAYEALRTAPAPIPPGQLAREVFGLVTPGAAGRWAGLLDEILAVDDRFRRTSDGWMISAMPRQPVGETVVAVAIATTGADPRRHRLVRLSAVRRGPGGAVTRFDSPLNPGRCLAGYLRSAARITQDDADGAPTFGDLADGFRDFVGDDPIHAYGAGWVRSYLEAELARIEASGLVNAFVELAELDERAANRGKPTLAALADRLGISHPRPGFPPADADVAARVALALRAAGSPLLPGDVARLDPSGAEPAAPALLDRRWLDAAPSGPGVYLIEDAAGGVLYVGKAVDLRRRLTAYVGRAFGLHRQLEGLAVRATRVRTEPTETDIEARLLEARLLRRHRPPFNVQRRVRRSATLLRVAPHDRGACVRAVRDVESDGALYFGPYRSARAARAHLDLVGAIYPAAVERGEPIRKGRRKAVLESAQEHQTSARAREERRTAALAAGQLLSGQKDATLLTLRDRMRRAGLAGDARALEQARRLIRAVLDLEPCPSPLLGVSPTEPLLVTEARPDGRFRAHLVRDGFVVASTTLEPARTRVALRMAVDHLSALAAPPDDPEDALIVLRWLMEPVDGRTIVPLRRLHEDTSDGADLAWPGADQARVRSTT